MKIHIIGASGTGTSTLGRQIAEKFGCKQIETDYYAWKQTDPPFVEYRDYYESQALLREVFNEYPNLVLCGSIASWGHEFGKEFNLVIFLKAPTKVRIKRLISRERELYGSRVLPGGDMFEKFEEFLEYAKKYDSGDLSARSLSLHKKFIDENITCPVLKVNTNRPRHKVLSKIYKKIIKIKKKLGEKTC